MVYSISINNDNNWTFEKEGARPEDHSGIGQTSHSPKGTALSSICQNHIQPINYDLQPLTSYALGPWLGPVAKVASA